MKIGIKQILSWVGALLIVAVLVVGDVLCGMYEGMITPFFCGTGENFDNAKEAMQQSDALVQQISEDSIVMLKNDGILPLAKNERKINVFGYGATENGFLMRGLGSGSSSINTTKAFSLVEFNGKKEQGALYTEGFEINQTIYDIFKTQSGSPLRPSTVGSGNVYNLSEPDVSLFTNEIMTEAKEFSEVAMLVLSRCAGENASAGEIPEAYLDITTKEKAILDLMTQWFDKVIVVLNTSNTMHAGFLDDPKIGAAISVGLMGQSGALAIPRLLKGEKETEVYKRDDDGNLVKDEDGKPIVEKTEIVQISPSGKLADVMTYDNSLDPTWANRKPGSNKGIQYSEGVYYGYKWYETAEKEGFLQEKGKTYDQVVQYPFGFGESYTDFSWEITELSLKDGSTLTKNSKNGLDSEEITVKVQVRNTGDYYGKDTVQLYFRPPYTSTSTVEKADINLLDFAKTTSIEPNNTERFAQVELSFSAYDLASWDAEAKNGQGAWVLEAGTYEFMLRTDSHTDKDMTSSTAVVKGGKNKFTYEVKNDIILDKDPVSENEVKNRFTGEDAYANCPIDGSAVNATQKYMSRKDFAGTFPTAQAVMNAPTTAMTNFVYDANPSATKPTFGVGGDLTMTLTETGSKPTAADLTGKGAKLKYNTDLLKTLWDFDADEWEELLDQMTENEVEELIIEGGFKRVAVPSVGKPTTYDYDGPAGFNVNTQVGNIATTDGWTAFPSECLIGQSWNKDLMFSMGRSMAAEGNLTNVNGWYAPGVNLHRSAYTARNYEYYSEDGVLSGKLAGQLVYGAKTNGMICYIKHFVVSEEGPNPRNVNTWLTEQNLRENYLRPFEIAIKEGKGNGLMTAFNNVGANWCGANGALVTEVLRGEWGFKGVVITDWCNGGLMGEYGCNKQGVRAGNDLWLNPGSVGGTRISMSDAKDAYAARYAAKNILYAQVDAIMTQQDLIDRGVNFDDIQAQVGVGFKENVFRWWIILLVLINVIGAAGVVLLLLFYTFFPLSKAHDAQMAAAVAGANSGSSGTGSDAAAESTVTDEKDEDEE